MTIIVDDCLKKMLIDFVKTLPQWLLPKKTLTRFAGVLANVRSPQVKNALISGFIQKFKVNMKEALEENPEAYATFNDFFTRALKSGIRPLADLPVICPVDGVLSEFGAISEGQLLQAKGRYYHVNDLLSTQASLAERFTEGHFATFYLAPKDYHRVHMPMAGKLCQMKHINGKLFSVQPTTVRMISDLFPKNERLVAFFETEWGMMAMVLVGAVVVGGISTVWEGVLSRKLAPQEWSYSNTIPAISLQKGDEMGAFRLGSTVVLLFERDMPLSFISSLTAGSEVRLGEALGTLSSNHV